MTVNRLRVTVELSITLEDGELWRRCGSPIAPRRCLAARFAATSSRLRAHSLTHRAHVSCSHHMQLRHTEATTLRHIVTTPHRQRSHYSPHTATLPHPSPSPVRTPTHPRTYAYAYATTPDHARTRRPPATTTYPRYHHPPRHYSVMSMSRDGEGSPPNISYAHRKTGLGEVSDEEGNEENEKITE